MKILVTGSRGFLGSYLVKHLGTKYKIVEDNNKPFPSLEKKAGIDVVLHCAGKTGNLDKQQLLESHHYTKQFFRQLVDVGCPRVVVMSSIAVYGNQKAPFSEETPTQPLTPYAEMKLKLEELVAQFSGFGLRSSILRFSDIYGPGDECRGDKASMIFKMAQEIKNGRPPVLYKFGEQHKDWLHISDAARAIDSLLSSGEAGSGHIYNIGSNTAYSFAVVAETIADICKVPVTEPTYIDLPSPATYQWNTSTNFSRANATFGFKPRMSLRDGITDILKLIKAEGQPVQSAFGRLPSAIVGQ